MFKVGDRVKCIKSYPEMLEAQQVYTISEISSAVTVRLLNEGGPYMWATSRFELAETSIDHGSYIVVLQRDDGTLNSSRAPRVYPSREKAEQEAQRLAKENTGVKFTVFHMVTEVVQPKAPLPPIEVKKVA